MRKQHSLVALVSTACMVATACGGSTGRSDDQRQGQKYATNGTFTMALRDDFGAFDPYRGNVFGVDRIAYDSLINLQPDGTFVTGIADKWSADAHAASFSIRSDVTCSDGTRLTASQIATDLNFLGDPANKSRQYGVNTPSLPFTATGNDATRTVRVVMDKEPFGFLLNTIGQAPIMCSKGLKDPTILKSTSDGTGPFVLTKVDPGQSYTFKVRKDYKWGPDAATTKAPGTPATVVLRIVTNETTAANLLLSGEINMARFTGEERHRLEAQSLKKFNVADSGAGIRFNQRPGHVAADKRVRQALVQALDLGKLVKVSTGGTGRAATGLARVDPRACVGDNVSGQLPQHSVAAAQALLDQAGWVRGTDGIRSKNGKRLVLQLRFLPFTSAFDHATVELMAEQWRAIGVIAKISADSATGYTKVIYDTGNWDVWAAIGTAYQPSAWVPYLSGPFPPKGTNLGGANAQYDRLVAKAKKLTPPAACKYWNQAEQAVYRNLDLVPISDRYATFYLHHAEAAYAGYVQPIPTSIRVLD